MNVVLSVVFSDEMLHVVGIICYRKKSAFQEM